MSCITFQNVDKSLALIEKAFNIAGWIPATSRITGPIRVTAGQVMMVVAAILTALVRIGGYITGNKNLVRKGDQIAPYVAHGLANVIRGTIEAVPASGNLVTFLYDLDPWLRLRYKDEPLPVFRLI